MMEEILTSIGKHSENLAVKTENSWESEAEFDHVAGGSKLNGNILHFNENMPNAIGQDKQESSEKYDFLIDLEIENKTIENVAIRSDCLLQDVAEELAKNEMVKVVYFLQEKIRKGCYNCDASEAQVLVKLRSNWKWICINELVEDTTVTFEEVFADMPDHLKPLFRLAPKVDRKTDSHVGQQTINSPQSVASYADPGAGLIMELRDLLDKHKVSELSQKDSQLEKDILTHLSCEAPVSQASQNMTFNLKKYLCGLHKILNSLPLSPSTVQHPKQQVCTNTDSNTDSYTSEQDKMSLHCVRIDTQENYNDHCSFENLNESSSAPLSRHRTSFDIIKEVPRLKQWFKEYPSPNKSVIKHYVCELNASEFRRDKIPVTEKAVYIWFKNARARKDKMKKP